METATIKNGFTSIDLGNFGCKERALKLCSILEGKTYMNFMVSYSPCAGNYPVCVTTESDVTEDELRRMVTYYLACEI
jgi:hypothetical protein